MSRYVLARQGIYASKNSGVRWPALRPRSGMLCICTHDECGVDGVAQDALRVPPVRNHVNSAELHIHFEGDVVEVLWTGDLKPALS